MPGFDRTGPARYAARGFRLFKHGTMTNPFRDPLPVDAALPALRQALAAGRAAVLVAPPGAGKTTRVPLALAG